jgi:hypothetical protein
MPLLYRNVSVRLGGNKKNIQSLVSTLAASEAGGRSMGPFIRALSIYQGFPVTRTYKIPEDDVAILQDLLSQSYGLETVRMYDASAIITHVCERACKTSLLHLVVHCDPGAQFSRLLPIGLFAGLRTLHIAMHSLSPDVLPSLANAWTLPNLHELRWEESIYYILNTDVHTLKFLALCQFPRLRRLELCVEVDIDDGSLLLSKFLHTHAEIEDLDLVGAVVNEDSLAVSISKTKMTRFSLQRDGSVTPLLVHWLPPSLKRLDLPVFLEPEVEEDTDICAVLHMLLNHAKGNLREVHLAIGHPWGERERVSPGRFRFDSSTPKATGISTSQHQAIQHVSAKLGALGINVYDEDGMTMADYEQ